MKRENLVAWWYGGGLLAVLFTLLPLYLMVKVSVSPPAEVFTPHPSFALHEVPASTGRPSSPPAPCSGR